LMLVGRAARGAALDVFHAPHYVVPYVGTRVVVTIHDLIHLRLAYRNPLQPRYARNMIRRAGRASAAVLTVSESVRAEIEREFPSARGKIEAIPNGVLPPFGPEEGPRDETVLADLGLARRAYFLYVGNDKPHKRLDLLAEAWRAVRPGMPDVRLALAGGASALGAPDGGIVFAGRVADQDLAALYRGALALVLPSDFEGFGLPVLEAMASGTPVICSDIPPLRELAAGAARFFERGDAAALARAMSSIRASDPMRLAEAGLRRAAGFPWDRAAERTLAAYRRVLRS
ncbi:MAG TPA: glycosyltransferase family 1 protein, partial [Thermoanaerobaculia bacterium]